MASKHVLVCFSRCALVAVAVLGSSFTMGCGGDDSNKDGGSVAPSPVVEDSMKNQMEFMKKQQAQQSAQP